MSSEKKVFKDANVQLLIGNVLRYGVILAMSVVFLVAWFTFTAMETKQLRIMFLKVNQTFSKIFLVF